VSLPVVLRAEAIAEFDDAFDFYDQQHVGLGPEFAAEVQRAFDRIAGKPDLHPCVFSDIRKSAVRRFPYSIFYRSHADRIEVIAVFHTSRDPAVWRGRA
jgi:plasmid stabilization system protein ParE